jgi:hypothetical protein
VRAGRAEQVLASRSDAAPRGDKSTVLIERRQARKQFGMVIQRNRQNRERRKDRKGGLGHEVGRFPLMGSKPFAILACFAVEVRCVLP